MSNKVRKQNFLNIQRFLGSYSTKLIEICHKALFLVSLMKETMKWSGNTQNKSSVTLPPRHGNKANFGGGEEERGGRRWGTVLNCSNVGS